MTSIVVMAVWLLVLAGYAVMITPAETENGSDARRMLPR